MIATLKRLLPYLRPLRGPIFLVFITGVAVTLISGLVPVLVQLLFEVYNRSDMASFQRLMPEAVLARFPFNEENRTRIAHLIPFLFPLLYFLLGLLRFVHGSLINIISEQVAAGVRIDLVRKTLRLNLSYLGTFERGSGGLMSRVFNDPILLQQGLVFYVDLIREPIQAAIYLAYMFWLDWKLTLFALLFVPIFLGSVRKMGKSLRKHGIASRDAIEDLSSIFKDAVDGVRVVQSFNLEGEMLKRFRARIKTYLETAKKIVVRENAVSPMNEFVISWLLMSFAIYSIDEVLSGSGNSATFIGFMAAAGFLQAPIKKLQDASVKIQQMIVVTDRMFSIIENGAEVPQNKSPVPFPKDWKKIVFRDVSFNYGKNPVLKNVNLEVKRGEVLALVGESGSGKSTLVNLLERFYDPTEGEILIDDVPINKMSLNELRHNIALVTQDVFLFRDSIAKNIQAGDFEKVVVNVEEVARLANAQKFIVAMPEGFDSSVGERGAFLSGGEKQRISIARAIFKDAPILILDEATSALDSVSEQEVQRGLDHLLESRTAFVIAHRLSTIFGADRILVMKKGEIVEQGSHEELIRLGGEYRGVFELQMNYENRAP